MPFRIRPISPENTFARSALGVNTPAPSAQVKKPRPATPKRSFIQGSPLSHPFSRVVPLTHRDRLGRSSELTRPEALGALRVDFLAQREFVERRLVLMTVIQAAWNFRGSSGAVFDTRVFRAGLLRLR